MLAAFKARVAKGDLEGARAALREAVSQVCVARFVAGWTRHPLLAPQSRGFLKEVVDSAVALGEEAPLETADAPRVNALLERLIPDFALLLDEALTDAKHELGGRVSNVESDNDRRFPSLLGWQAELVADAAEEVLKAGISSRLDALERVRLADLDEGGAGIVDGLLVFNCPCGAERREPLESSGVELACDCGQVLTVPRARLDLMAAYLKQKRDAARGISRCRVCKGIIQLGKQGFMRAGFCDAYCAKRGQELFREYVAREGIWVGEEIVFACVCGREHRAAESEVGTKRPCEGCGIEVWVPLAGAARRPKGVGSCAHCGRVMKASAARCMYCGRARP